MYIWSFFWRYDFSWQDSVIRVPEQCQSRFGEVAGAVYNIANTYLAMTVTKAWSYINDVMSMVILELTKSRLYLYTWDAIELVECVAYWFGCCKAQPQMRNADTVALSFRDTLKEASLHRHSQVFCTYCNVADLHLVSGLRQHLISGWAKEICSLVVFITILNANVAIKTY